MLFCVGFAFRVSMLHVFFVLFGGTSFPQGRATQWCLFVTCVHTCKSLSVDMRIHLTMFADVLGRRRRMMRHVNGWCVVHGLNTGAALIHYVHQGCACDISAHVKNPMWFITWIIWHWDDDVMKHQACHLFLAFVPPSRIRVYVITYVSVV